MMEVSERHCLREFELGFPVILKLANDHSVRFQVFVGSNSRGSPGKRCKYQPITLKEGRINHKW